MTKTDYSALDAEILNYVATKFSNYSPCHSADLLKIADPLSSRDRFGLAQGWRVIDRRLQALRIKGKIAFGRPPGSTTVCWYIPTKDAS